MTTSRATGFLMAGLCLTGLALTQDVSAQSSATSTIVTTKAGDVEGVAEQGVTSFKGIRFAAPPVDDLRWRAPKSALPWTGILKANAYGKACIQKPGLSAANGGEPGPLGEDCLFLNVWTPRPERSAKLPVMVWIHGGAYIFGAGGLNIYDGAPMARKGAVMVNFNYRLGQLGFFRHPALLKEDQAAPANFGLLDQIAALQWVRDNIAEFGGDPNNVTIMGQSAGGKSVLALFASPLARGLFNKGVAQSSYIVPDATEAKALAAGGKVADALGLKGADATAAELRAVPAERFGILEGDGVSLSPVPMAGDKVLPRSIEDTFAAGREAPLPLILGNTSDDASVAFAFGIDPATVLKRLGAAGFLVRSLYPGVKDDAELARQATRDLVFTMSARWIADRHARRAKTWRYYFDYTAEKEGDRYPYGVPHGSEISYLLDTLDVYEGTKDTATAKDRAFAGRASDYLFSFARTGKPSSRGAPDWPNDSGFRDRTLYLGDKIEVRNRFMRARLNVFIGVTKVIDAVLGRT